MIQSLRLRLYVSPGKSCSMSNETPEEQEQEQEMILSTQEFSVISHSLCIVLDRTDSHEYAIK